MPLILCIESSTKRCSVALWDGQTVLASRSAEEAHYTHSENLHVFIEDVLKESQVDVSALQAIAVSKGPGSYTGLRIGVSAAKGLAYALSIPLIACDTLELMSRMAAREVGHADFYLPMIDARRMEVYTRFYSTKMEAQGEVKAAIIEEGTFDSAPTGKVVFFGDGAEKSRPLLESRAWEFLPNIVPDALFMGEMAQEAFDSSRFEDTAYFEPYYLKDFIAGTPKKLL